MLVTKSAFRARGALNYIKRGFAASAGHGHDDHHDDHSHGHHGHDDHEHDDHGDHGDHGHDDHHHHHIEKADWEHKFVAANVNKHTMIFDGLKASQNATFTLDNVYRHHNDLPLTQ